MCCHFALSCMLSELVPIQGDFNGQADSGQSVTSFLSDIFSGDVWMLQLAPRKGNKANLPTLRPEPEVTRIPSLLGAETASVDPYFMQRFAPTAGGSFLHACVARFTSAAAALRTSFTI